MMHHNLIWIHVEGGGGGGGGALLSAGCPTPLQTVPYPSIQLANMVCGWISTIGSVSGLITGVSPAFLLKNHVSKGVHPKFAAKLSWSFLTQHSKIT